jgi:hypothetical protein
MNNFSQFNIKPTSKGFEGDKIKIDRIINKQVVVYAYLIKDSKFKDLCLHMQIHVDNTKRVVFTGSKNLIEMIQKVPAEGFPFTTTIIVENDRYQFT